MKDRRAEIRELLAEIGETQTWLGEQMGKSKQEISQKMNAKNVKLDFFEKAMAVIEQHPRFKRSKDVHINGQVIHSSDIDVVIKIFSERIIGLEKIIAEQAKTIGMLEERVKWASKSK